MPRRLDEKNRRADQVNPTKSGIRTGNPQLEAKAGTARRTGKGKRRTLRVKSGERRGG
jgi:hypothetical protein